MITCKKILNKSGILGMHESLTQRQTAFESKSIEMGKKRSFTTSCVLERDHYPKKKHL